MYIYSFVAILKFCFIYYLSFYINILKKILKILKIDFELYNLINPNLTSTIQIQLELKKKKMRLDSAWLKYLELESGLSWFWINCFLNWIEFELVINTKPNGNYFVKIYSNMPLPLWSIQI